MLRAVSPAGLFAFTSAPREISACTTSSGKSSDAAASINAVRPSASFMFGSAPASRRRFPHCPASPGGSVIINEFSIDAGSSCFKTEVAQPSHSALTAKSRVTRLMAFASAAQFWSRRMTDSSPERYDSCTAVVSPARPGPFARAFAPRSSSKRTIGAAPWRAAATISGVRPSPDRTLILAPRSRSSLVFSRSSTAQINAVAPAWSARFGSAPASSSIRTVARSP